MHRHRLFQIFVPEVVGTHPKGQGIAVYDFRLESFTSGQANFLLEGDVWRSGKCCPPFVVYAVCRFESDDALYGVQQDF